MGDTLRERSSTMEEPAAEPSREVTAVALESAVPEAVPEVAPQAPVNDTPAQKEKDAAAETVEGTVDNKKRKEEQVASKPKAKGCSSAKTAEEERRQRALANWAKAKPAAKGKEGGSKKWKAKANANGK